MDTDPPTQTHSSQEHVYDDIVEHDNKLPLWWQLTLYGAIVFGLIYWYGRRLDAIASPVENYRVAAAARHAAEAEQARSSAVSDAMLTTLAADQTTIAQGHELFVSTCAPCHRADAGGNIGPNLTDAYWLHGGKPTQIYRTAYDGVQTKGMPTWGPQLGERRLENVVAYVLSIRNTNVPNGKAAQGDLEP